MNPTTITAQPGTPYIDVVREFDAPPELVFRAHTDPELVARWLGPRGMQMEVLNMTRGPAAATATCTAAERANSGSAVCSTRSCRTS
jgi:uncharacterized protein YndB with AHSA1/START domain